MLQLHTKWQTSQDLARWDLQQSAEFLKRDVIVQFAGWQQVVLNHSTVKYRGTCIQTSNTFHIFTEHQWNSFHWRHSLWMLYWCITHASALSAVKTSSFLVVVNWTQGTGYLHQSLLTDKHTKCRQTKATTILPCWQSHVVMSLI